MADITDPLVIAWSDNYARPISELKRNLNATIDAALIAYFDGVSTIVSANPLATDILIDNRAATGASVLSGLDLINYVTQLQAYQTQNNIAGVEAIISKPAIGAIQIG
jgi:hypothetical protein